MAQGFCGSGKAACEAAAVTGGGEQQGCVALPHIIVCIKQNGLVAAELQILGALFHSQPHQGIEPAHSGAEQKKEFGAAVLAANMYYLVPEYQLKLLFTVAAPGQYNTGAAAGKTDGEWNKHIGGYQKAEAGLFDA